LIGMTRKQRRHVGSSGTSNNIQAAFTGHCQHHYQCSTCWLGLTIGGACRALGMQLASRVRALLV
jgi:hypothetical protein